MTSHLDIESQCVDAVEEGGSTQSSTRQQRLWRHIRWTVIVTRAFATSSLRNIKQPLLASCEQGREAEDVGLLNRSTSIDVPSSEEINEDEEDNCCHKEQQYAYIAQIVKTEDLNSLNQFGGVRGFAEALGTDLDKGLPDDVDELRSRSQTLLPHSGTQDPQNGFFCILDRACNKYIIILILLCVILLLVLGIKEEGWKSGWYEGILIICAIILLVLASIICEYWSLWRSSNINNSSSIRENCVYVLRGGHQSSIPISNVVLGDIICLNVGNEVPADGIFIRGESLMLDEKAESVVSENNPFLFCGAYVIRGKGHMLVTAVGKDTDLEMMNSEVNASDSKASLKLQVDWLNLRKYIVTLLVYNFQLMVVILRSVFVKKHDDPGYPDLKSKPAAMREFVEASQRILSECGKFPIVKSSLIMALLGFGEMISLMVNLAIGYWSKKVMSGKAIARDIMVFATIGSLTVICTDIHGALSQNAIEFDIYIGGEELITEESNIPPNVLRALCDGIRTLQRPVSIREQALLSWASVKFGEEIDGMKEEYRILDAKVSNEVYGALMRNNKDNQDSMYSHWYGPTKEILSMSSRYYDSAGAVRTFNERKRKDLETSSEVLQSKYLKIIAFGYKQVNASMLEETDLILAGLVGLRHSSKKDVEALKEAGVDIKLLSSHSVEELKALATQWRLNIPNPDSVIKGEQFRNYSHAEKLEMVDTISIMGDSLPFDKLLMVEYLMRKGHVVGMVGATSRCMPSMLNADVGITMGECRNEAVRDSADIVITDNFFNTLISIMTCGHCARAKIQNFVRIELTMATALLIIGIITSIRSGDSPFTSIQIFWICLIEPLLGGLALLTESLNDVTTKKWPAKGITKLVTRTMWISIVTEAFYQTAVLVTFQYKGSATLGISKNVVATMMFNSFVFCQVFNWFNAPELKENVVFSKLYRNSWFWVAFCAIVVLQEIFIEMAHILAKSARLNIEQWSICFLIGGGSSVIDGVNKCVLYLAARRFPRQLCCVTRSTDTNTTPATSEPLSSLELPVITASV